jgi:hypothetical protein
LQTKPGKLVPAAASLTWQAGRISWKLANPLYYGQCIFLSTS